MLSNGSTKRYLLVKCVYKKKNRIFTYVIWLIYEVNLMRNMNANIEYEKFTQEIYQELVNADVVKSTKVKHNIKILGKSGQKHQIDVYWEYEIAGVLHKVAVECKNYNKPIPISKVRDFYGVLSDLDNVSGIMVTKIGYQEGAKKIGSHYGISLKELRTPNQGEAIVAEVKTCINVSVRHCLFEVDDIWAKENGLDLQAYRERLDCLNFPPKEKWLHSIYIPLQVKDRSICNAKGEIIDTLDNLENQLRPDEDHIFSLENSYIDTHCGLVKIRAIKYEYEQNNKPMNISIDAQEFIKAILKDALNGEIRLVAKR